MNPVAVVRAGTMSEPMTEYGVVFATATRTDTISGMSQTLRRPVKNGRKRMSEYIRRGDAITAACKGFCHPGARCPETPCGEQTKYLRELPSADVVQVVHGKWIEEWWHGEKTRKCSVCNLTQTVNTYKGEVKFKYCPYCGAKMDREE